MRKLLFVSFLVGCSEEAPPPPPPAPKPASQPVAAAASAPASAPAQVVVEKGPRVVSVEGVCEVDGKKAYVGMPLKADSVIETKADSKLAFSLMPGGLTQVRANGKIELGKSERKDVSIKLLAGAIWSFLPKGKASYEVVSSNAVAGVRGTIFYMEEKAKEDSYTCDCDGEVEMIVAGKKKLLKSKMQHQGMTVVGVKPKPEKKPLNHTKDEALALEKLAKTIL